MKLNSITIENLRSLIAPHTYPLHPLTIVVGANSSGKSTFLRLFPLLRQSVETITKGPVLWFGRIVDFGVFTDAVSRGTPDSDITFGFEVTLEKNWEGSASSYYFPYLTMLEDTKVSVALKVSQVQGTANTYTKQIRTEIHGHVVEINADPDGSVCRVLLNGKEIKSGLTKLAVRSGASLFSMSVSRRSDPQASVNLEADWLNARQLGAFPDLILDHVGPLFHGGTDKGKRAQMTRWLGIGSPGVLLTQLRGLAGITATSAQRAKTYKADSNWIKQLQSLVIADRIPQILNEIDSFLSATFRGVSYIGPLRATAERFYRQQDLAVDEVDPEGANLAMFLMGLSESGRMQFSEWCKDNIGFSVEAATVGAHVSINLRDTADGGIFNIADMGFGYSQLLPVLATVWRALTTRPTYYLEASNMRRRILAPTRDQLTVPKIIAVEQPELHLHPRLQGKLADLLVGITRASSSDGVPVHLICETHSETIINRIGSLIANGDASPDQVQVFLFEKQDGNLGTMVRTAHFNRDGVLENWPYGFFLPVED